MQYDGFHEGAHFYFRDALLYIRKKFPINNEVICNSTWVDVVKRLEASWDNVEFFLEKFPSISFMAEIDNDSLFEEFIDYQSLTDDDIGAAAWKDAEVTTIDRNKQRSVHYRVDVLWYHIYITDKACRDNHQPPQVPTTNCVNSSSYSTQQCWSRKII